MVGSLPSMLRRQTLGHHPGLAFPRASPLTTHHLRLSRSSPRLAPRLRAQGNASFNEKPQEPGASPNAGESGALTPPAPGRRSFLALVPLVGGASAGFQGLVLSPLARAEGEEGEGALPVAAEGGEQEAAAAESVDSQKEIVGEEASAAVDAESASGLEEGEAVQEGETVAETENAGEVTSESESESESGSESDKGVDTDSDSDSDSESDSEGEAEESQESVGSTAEPEVTSKVFLDIAIEGAPAGRIVIGLYGKDVPLGASRFEALARGDRGISLRRKEFLKLTPAFVQNAGIRTFSLTGSSADEARFPGGTQGETLVAELEKGQSDPRPALHNVAGAVSILAYDPTIPPPKQKLVAKNGKLITVEEEVRSPPNGTEFTICFEDSPELDVSHVVVGKVLEGQDAAIAAIRKVPYVQDNSGSPYFKAAKLIGDTRAVVAERGFNRPFKKITVLKCGVL